MAEYDNIYREVELLVCEVVSSYTNVSVSAEELYVGLKNIPFCRSVARNMSFYVLHNMYGISYTKLAARSGKDARSVMRCVRKSRERLDFDQVYRDVSEEIRRKIYEEE